MLPLLVAETFAKYHYGGEAEEAKFGVQNGESSWISNSV